MGGKQTGARKQVYICTAVLLISIIVAGCQYLPFNKKEAPPKRDEAATHLAYGKKLFGEGDYLGAVRELERVFSTGAKNPVAEEALLYLGFINADPANQKRDHSKATIYLKRLSDGYPRSVLTEQARITLAILRENDESGRTVERLKAIIEASKKVDRDIEEKRRERTGGAR